MKHSLQSATVRRVIRTRGYSFRKGEYAFVAASLQCGETQATIRMRNFYTFTRTREKRLLEARAYLNMRPAVTSHCSRRLTFGATASRGDSPQPHRASERATNPA